MSGGHFEYKDQSARFQIEETIDNDIEILQSPDSFDDLCEAEIAENNAQLELALKLKPAADLFFQMLKDYDYAASGDSSFVGALEEFNVKRAELIRFWEVKGE